MTVIIDTKSDPGAWADEIASTGRFRAVAAPAWKLVPVEPTQEAISAAMTSKARDDEGEFPPLMDLIDFSGENAARAVVRAALRAAIAAAPEPPADPRDAEIARLRAENEQLKHRLKSALKARNLWTDDEALRGEEP
jgi:hypothetical protein